MAVAVMVANLLGGDLRGRDHKALTKRLADPWMLI